MRYRRLLYDEAGKVVGHELVSDKQEPGLLRKAANFVGAVAKHAATGLQQVAPEVKAARLALCMVCERISDDKTRCLECGCPAERKASWSSSTCPLGKW